jgi:uncharacterized protein VirK/YbjX
MRPRLTARWFRVLSLFELEQAAEIHPYFYRKLQLGYVSRTFDAAGRLQLLEQHYRFLKRRLSPRATKSLFDAGIPLAFLRPRMPSPWNCASSTRDGVREKAT